MESDISYGEMYPGEIYFLDSFYAKQKPASLEDTGIEIVLSTMGPGLCKEIASRLAHQIHKLAIKVKWNRPVTC